MYEALADLFGGLSVLTSLRMRYVKLGSRVIHTLPLTLKVLDGYFSDVGKESWDDSIWSLSEVCLDLRRLRIDVHGHPSPYRRKLSWHKAIENMTLRGIEVVCPSCIISKCTSSGPDRDADESKEWSCSDWQWDSTTVYNRGIGMETSWQYHENEYRWTG